MKKLRHFHPMYRCGYPNMSPSSCSRQFTSVCMAWHLSISPTFASQSQK